MWEEDAMATRALRATAVAAGTRGGGVGGEGMRPLVRELLPDNVSHGACARLFCVSCQLLMLQAAVTSSCLVCLLAWVDSEWYVSFILTNPPEEKKQKQKTMVRCPSVRTLH